MSQDPAAWTFFDKAQRALAAARVLLSIGNADGACNRAYYAMFDAAHAALLALAVETGASPIKTHNGLIAKFGQHLVRTGRSAAAHGEAFNGVERIRLLADYSGDPVEIEKAAWSVERAEAFLAAIAIELGLDP